MKHLIITTIMFTCLNILAQVSQSSNISLNSILLNPAFAGSKNKNRISIQNSFQHIGYDFKYHNSGGDINNSYKSDSEIYRFYRTSNQVLGVDGLIKKYNLGYGIVYSYSRSSESNNYYNYLSNKSYYNSNIMQSSSEVEYASNYNLFTNNSLSGILNYKIYLKPKEDNNAGTLTIGLLGGLNFINDKLYQNNKIYNTNYDFNTDSTIYKNSGYTVIGNNSYIKPSKYSVGVIYNIKNGYIGTSLNSININSRSRISTWGINVGYTFAKKTEKPKFSFSPQFYINTRLNYKTLNPNLSFERTSNNYYFYGYQSLEVDPKFCEFQYNELSFTGQKIVLNLDFRYNKIMFGVVMTEISNGLMLGLGYTNFKIALNYQNRSSNRNGGNFKQNISLVTNILF